MKYGQKVRVTSGFYEGMEGYLVEYIPGTGYKVSTVKQLCPMEFAIIEESDLEIIN